MSAEEDTGGVSEKTTQNKGQITQNNKTSSFKNPQFTKWAESSTIHGVDHIFTGKSKVRRIVWAIILVGAIAGCLYGIIDRSIYFSTRPTATTVTADINDDGIVFPAVTVCNLNPISRRYADQRNLTGLLGFLLFTGTQRDRRVIEFLGDNDCRSNLDDIGNSNVSSLSLKTVFTDGVIRDFIQSCHFGGPKSEEDCQPELVETLTPHGLCYTFQGSSLYSPPRLVRQRGERFGLRMIFNISQNDYMHYVNGDAGIKVSVHTRDEQPDPLSNGISVPPNMHASIALSSRRSVSKPEISRCSLSNSPLSFFPGVSYTSASCRINEYYERSFNQCDCVDVATPPPNSHYSAARNCNVADVCCLYDNSITINSSCLPACEEMDYSYSVSYSQYPSKRALSLLTQLSGETSQSFEEDIVSITVYFDSLHTIVTSTDYSYSVTALLADIGGQLALFIGASIISFMELVLLLFDETKCCAICTVKKTREAIEEHELKKLEDQTNLETQEEKDEQKTTPV